MKKMIRFFKEVKKAILKRYNINKYDNYTIAEYFRKQGAQIGDNCFISVRKLGAEPYLIKIGNHVAITAGVQFLTHGIGWNYRDKIPDLQLFGKIVIEDNCNIGVNSIILPNVTIGRNCIIGAGSVVTKDIPPNSIAAGNPAKVIGDVENYFEKAHELWKGLKPNGYMQELNRGEVYTPEEFSKLRAKPNNKKLLKNHLINYFWGN